MKKPSNDTEKLSGFKRYAANLARKQNLAMFETLRGSDPSMLRPRLTLGKLFAYIYSGLFYLIGLAIIFGTFYFIVASHFAICLSLIGIVLLLVIWVMRPRFGKYPEKYFTRADIPSLYAVTDDIAREFKIRPVNGITFNDDFNATYSRVGLPRKTLLVMGVPLWNVLDSQERIALLAHELAHGANGDAKRRFFVQTVYDSLITWVKILYPPRPRNLFDFPSAILLLWLSRFALWNARLLQYLLSWESRRAEYLADYLASTIAGTLATRSLLGKLYFGKTLHNIRSSPLRSYVKFDSSAFYEQVKNTPLEELERINEPDSEEIARLDLSHPPLGYRMQFLSAKFIAQPKLQISEELSNKMSDEMNTALQKKQRVRFYEDEFWQNLPKKAGTGKPK